MRNVNLVSEIVSTMAGGVPDELVDEVSSEYASLCETINSRCADVASLLADGYRDEALLLAEQEPRLLSLIAKLDFPERIRWKDYLAERGFKAPPELNHDAASVIEEAYEQQRQLEPLMRKHRLLALSRAPLNARIQILRKLDQADSGNPIWAGDIEKFELARIEEIRRESRAATKAGDVQLLAKLAEELNGPWSIKIPGDVRSFVAGSSGDLARNAAVEQLKPLADRLNDALLAFDVETGYAAREEWRNLNATAQVGPGEPLYERAAEALHWLDEVDAQQAEDADYELAIGSLERALDDELDLETVEQRWYTVQRFKREIPLALVERFNEYRERILGNRRRRSTLRVAAVAASILAVGVLLGLYLFIQSRQRSLQEARAQAAAFRDQNDLTAAEKWLAGMPVFVQKDGEVLGSVQQLRSTLVEVEQFRAQIEESIASVDLKGSLDNSVDGVIARAVTLTDELEKRRIAPADERSRIDSLRLQVEAERERRLRERTVKFNGELGRLAEELKSVEQIPMTADPRSRLAQLMERMNEFKTRYLTQVDRRPAVENAALEQVNVLLQRIEGRLKSLAEYQRSLNTLQSITTASRDPKEYAKALTNFANDFPASPWSSDFRKTATELDWWLRLANWQKLAQNPNWIRLVELSKADAATLLKDLENAEKDSSFPAFAEQVNQAKAVLKGIEEGRKISKEEIIKKINDTFSGEDYTQQYLLVERSSPPPDVWRYLRGAVRADANRENFNYDYFKNIFRQDKQVKVGNNRPVSQISQAGLAGQCTIAAELQRIAGRSTGRSTEELLQELLTAALKKYPADDFASVRQPKTSPDPIVQANMVKTVMELAANGSPAMSSLLKESLDELTVSKFDGIDWFEGDNPQTMDKRKEAEGLLEKLRVELGDLGPKVAAWREQAAATGTWTELFAYQWAGWLRSSEGTVEVLSVAPLENGQELFVLLPMTTANQLEFLPAGTYSNGIVSDRQSERAYQSGRPVFIKQVIKKPESEQP